MADPLTTFFQGIGSLFSGTQQTQAPQATQGSAAPPGMPPLQPQSGVSGFLSNPLTQSALSAYLNYIGSPKREGVGHALEESGIGGLNAYNQARLQQLQPYILQAQLGNLQARTGQIGAETQLAGARTSQITGITAANQATASNLRQQIPHLDPSVQPRAALLADSIEKDTSKVYDPKEVAQILYTDPTKEAELKAQAGKASAEAGMIPAKQKELEAQAGKATAEAGLVPAREKALGASAAASEARAKYLDASKPMTEAQIEQSANAEGRAAITGMKPGYFETEKTFEARKAQAFQAAHDAAVQRIRSQGGAVRNAAALPEHATTGEGLPDGSTPNGDGTWTLPDGSTAEPVS